MIDLWEFHEIPKRRTPALNRQEFYQMLKRKYPILFRKRQMVRHRLRLYFMDLHGGRCSRCGFSDTRALQIDHVNGGGVQELRRLGYKEFLWRVVDPAFSKDYQVLCANCNWIKRDENREVAH